MRVLEHEKVIDTIFHSDLQEEINDYFGRELDDDSDLVLTTLGEVQHYHLLKDILANTDTDFDVYL